jgi:hypothetical protein
VRQLRYSVSHLTICLSGDTGRTPLVVIVVANSRCPPPLLSRWRQLQSQMPPNQRQLLNIRASVARYITPSLYRDRGGRGVLPSLY